MMVTFELAIDWLVAVAGLCVPVLFYPQIKLLKEVKEAKSLSLGTVCGSLVIQVLIAIQALFKTNFQLVFVQSLSISCLILIGGMIFYYRRWPGGRRY